MDEQVSLCVRAFFFNDTATTEIYTLSLHDALPISAAGPAVGQTHDRYHPHPPAAEPLGHLDRHDGTAAGADYQGAILRQQDRKSTRLNSSHANISYAVFCLKKKIDRALAHADASVS